METNEIIEGNKLIAEFMGAKMIVENYHGINIIEFPDKTTKDLFGLKYHSSWDCLMPVVEQCLLMGSGTEFENTHYVKIHDALWSLNIQAVWLAVVEFIKWYQKQPK